MLGHPQGTSKKIFSCKFGAHQLKMAEKEKDLGALVNHQMSISHHCDYGHEKGKCDPMMYQSRCSQ